MYAPGPDPVEYFERMERKRKRIELARQIVFDTLGVIAIALICTAGWWLR